jgi:hypothetical protein
MEGHSIAAQMNVPLAAVREAAEAYVLVARGILEMHDDDARTLLGLVLEHAREIQEAEEKDASFSTKV